MLADFLSPLWEFLFDKLGPFGIFIAVSSPIIFLAIIVGFFLLVIGVIGAIRNKHLSNILKKSVACENNKNLEAAWKYRRKYLNKVKSAPDEEYRMGMLCLKGREAGWSLPTGKTDPMPWLKRAADAKCPDAQFYLAGLRYRKHFENQPLESAGAVAEIRRLSDRGFEPATAFMKDLENQCQIHLMTSGKYDIQCAAMGDSHSQFIVGAKLHGTNLKEAMQWYLLAAEGGDPDAQLCCAEIYRHGEGNITKNARTAFSWHQKAAEQGQKDAIFSLGCMYATGEGCAKDYEQAIKWLEKSAELGSATAEHNIAVCYANLAKEYAEKNGLTTRLDRITDKQWRQYVDEMDYWKKKAEKHGYKAEE